MSQIIIINICAFFEYFFTNIVFDTFRFVHSVLASLLWCSHSFIEFHQSSCYCFQMLYFLRSDDNLFNSIAFKRLYVWFFCSFSVRIYWKYILLYRYYLLAVSYLWCHSHKLDIICFYLIFMFKFKFFVTLLTIVVEATTKRFSKSLWVFTLKNALKRKGGLLQKNKNNKCWLCRDFKLKLYQNLTP